MLYILLLLVSESTHVLERFVAGFPAFDPGQDWRVI